MPDPQAQSMSPRRSRSRLPPIDLRAVVADSPSMPAWPPSHSVAGVPSVDPSQAGASSYDARSPTRQRFAAGTFFGVGNGLPASLTLPGAYAL